MASHGSVAIITGSAQGIGYAITDALLGEGYKVCLSDVSAEKGEESLAELQKKHAADRAIFVQCDVTSKDSLEEVFTTTQKKFGRIDVVVNNAGIADEINRDRMVAINLMGTIYGCELALKYMGAKNGGPGGAIVSVASMAGVVPFPEAPAYAATKHAVVGFTRSYGTKVHFDENGVIFMAVCPLFVATPLLETAKTLISSIKDRSVGALTPETVADGVLKLLKDRRNGSTLMVIPGGLEYADFEGRLKELVDSLT